MAMKNEVLIAGGIVGAGLLWYLMSDADAATPPAPALPPRGDAPPAPPSLPGVPKKVFGSCAALNGAEGSDLGEDWATYYDNEIAGNPSGNELAVLAAEAQDAGYPGVSACLQAASTARGNAQIEKAPPGAKATDQTKTCSFWKSEWNAATTEFVALLKAQDFGEAFVAAQKRQQRAQDALTQLGCP